MARLAAVTQDWFHGRMHSRQAVVMKKWQSQQHGDCERLYSEGGQSYPASARMMGFAQGIGKHRVLLETEKLSLRTPVDSVLTPDTERKRPRRNAACGNFLDSSSVAVIWEAVHLVAWLRAELQV